MNNLREFFPDGTPIDEWFYQTQAPALDTLGKAYVITDYGVVADGKVHTKQIQTLIDEAAQTGGGVIVVPKGVYYTGALFFKQGVHLYVEDGGARAPHREQVQQQVQRELQHFRSRRDGNCSCS